jgi:tRNA threonylcarbamoyl adenosine modification protein YeaZ
VLLLAFDTATPAVTVALHDGERVLAEATTVDARRHGELLAPGIARVLAAAAAAPADLTAVAVGVGPGPYTGLRVGLVTALALGAALGVPVRGVCTLDVLARAAALDGPFLVATDAHRREVYWARYADPRTRLDGPGVARPAEVPHRGEPAVGAGAARYPDAFGDVRPPEHPSAAVLAGIAAAGARALGGGRLSAAIGPGIGPCCYEVGEEVATPFRETFGADVVRDGRLDLWTAAERALRAAGVEQVERFDLCTACDSGRFFSHRRDEGRTGRQGVIAYVA